MRTQKHEKKSIFSQGEHSHHHLGGGGIGSEEAAGDHLTSPGFRPPSGTGLRFTGSWSWEGEESDKRRVTGAALGT
jgi:hypothetical protein